jgi:glutamate-1-semialdehyde aminotransferase
VEPLLLVHQTAQVTAGTAKDTLLAKYNDLENVATLIEANKNEIAAIIVEPVAGIWVAFHKQRIFGRLTPNV